MYFSKQWDFCTRLHFVEKVTGDSKTEGLAGQFQGYVGTPCPSFLFYLIL